MALEISGKTLAEAAFHDIESFFFYGARFKINREFGALTNSHATCSGSGSNVRIKLSSDFCSHSILEIDDLLFNLLVLSHEIAHYLSFHNSHKDRDNKDTVAIEARADNFGAQISLTLTTFGKRTRSLIDRLLPSGSQAALIEAIGKATGRMYRLIFLQNTSNKYPPPMYRARLFFSGYLSFFNRYFGYLPEEWTLSFLLQSTRAADIIQHRLKESDVDALAPIHDTIHVIHRDLQESHSLVLQGIKPIFGYFLLSNFRQSEDIRATHKAQLEEMISKYSRFAV